MGDESENTQTQTQSQTQSSQIDWSQNAAPSCIPNIWGRLYSTKIPFNGKHFWRKSNNPEYFDLIQPEFSLGRALNCTYSMKKDMVKENIIKNVSKLHFTIKRDLSEAQCPAIITDFSYNGTFVNGEKVGKGLSRVLDDNDEISVTHPMVKLFIFKDMNEQQEQGAPKELTNKFYISRVLGQGACGLVKLVYDKTKCTKHAMKIIKKSRLTNGQFNHLTDPEKISNEINIMKSLEHPCIISTEEVFDTRDTVYIILELMQGGELYDRISKHGHLSEAMTRFLFRQMVLAVRYLHSQGITHRDLKPENVLLESKDEETLVKITDFGLSKFVGEDSFMKTVCGTPLYLAPEVIRANGVKCYGPEVDVWSLGVIFFVCLVGYLPFSPDYKDMSLTEQILIGRYRFSHEHWKGISLQAKLLMKRMLTVQVNRRITLNQILNHAWMQDSNTIIRVEKLLSYKIQLALSHQTQQTISSTCTEESSSNVDSISNVDSVSNVDSISNNADNSSNPDSITVMRLVAAGKRALSDSSNSEPDPKRPRLELCDKDDTNSTNSYYSEE